VGYIHVIYLIYIINIYVACSQEISPPVSSAGPPAKRRRVENDVDLDGEQYRVVCSIGSSAIWCLGMNSSTPKVDPPKKKLTWQARNEGFDDMMMFLFRGDFQVPCFSRE